MSLGYNIITQNSSQGSGNTKIYLHHRNFTRYHFQKSDAVIVFERHYSPALATSGANCEWRLLCKIQLNVISGMLSVKKTKFLKTVISAL
jgi:hypothetical protein